MKLENNLLATLMSRISSLKVKVAKTGGYGELSGFIHFHALAFTSRRSLELERCIERFLDSIFFCFVASSMTTIFLLVLPLLFEKPYASDLSLYSYDSIVDPEMMSLECVSLVTKNRLG